MYQFNVDCGAWSVKPRPGCVRLCGVPSALRLRCMLDASRATLTEHHTSMEWVIVHIQQRSVAWAIGHGQCGVSRRYVPQLWPHGDGRRAGG